MHRRNELDVIEDRSSLSVGTPMVGFVTKVYTHTKTDDKSNIEADVILRDGGKHLRRVPVLALRDGQISVPQTDDYVLIESLKGTSTTTYITGVIHTGKRRAPLAKNGHWRYEFDNGSGDPLYLEAEPSDHSAGEANVVRIAQKKDGLADPTARIELDTSTTDTVVRITRGKENQGGTDMGFELNFGTGAFKIGDGSGYGIVSDGSGNFTWYEQSVDFVDDGTTISW